MNDEGVKLSIPFRRKFITSENSKLKVNEVKNGAKNWQEYSCMCFTLELLHNNKGKNNSCLLTTYITRPRHQESNVDTLTWNRTKKKPL